MSDLKRLSVGRINGIPVDTWNRHNAATRIVERHGEHIGPPPTASLSRLPYVGLVGIGDGHDPVLHHAVSLDGIIADWPDDDSRLPPIKLTEAEEGKPLGIVQVDRADSVIVAVAGVCVAMVDIADATHTTAGFDPSAPTPGVIVSGKAGFDILYKPNTLGEGRCIVRFEGGHVGGIRQGLTTASVTPRADGPPVVPGVAQVQLYKDDGTGDFVADGDPVGVLNWSQLDTTDTGLACQVMQDDAGAWWLVSIDCEPDA